EEADPGGPAYRIEQQVADGYSRVKYGAQNVQDQRCAENESRVPRISQSRDVFRVDHAINERRNGDQESDDRAGSAYVEKCTIRSNGRADQNERAQCSDQRWEWNEERITGVNVVVTASEVVRKFVHEENGQKGEGEREATDEGSRMAIEQREIVEQ